jgi:hypothetical protein
MNKLSEIDFLLTQKNFRNTSKNLILNVTETDKDKITDDILEYYVSVVRGFSTLNLSFSKISSKSLNTLSKKNPDCIVDLNLSHCHKIYSLKDIPVFTKLEVLNLRHCSHFKLKNETLIYIRNCVSLVELNLDYCYVTDSLLSLFGTLKNLRKISLVGCTYISYEGVEFLSRMELDEINLSETCICRRALSYLSEMMRRRKVMVILKDCNIVSAVNDSAVNDSAVNDSAVNDSAVNDNSEYLISKL